ncbi:MAG: rubredoxin-like domain-containing protein [Bacillota bacterium]
MQCLVCGYIVPGESPPMRCPLCGAAEDKFRGLTLRTGDNQVMANVDWLDHLNNGVLYLAYALRAEEEGYPEIAAALYRIGRDKARHAAEWLNRRQPPGGSADNLRLLLRHEEATAANLSGLAGAARKAGDTETALFLERVAAAERRHGNVLRNLRQRLFGE